MKLRRVLSALARVIADEAERNPAFARQVAEALGMAQRESDAKLNATIAAATSADRRPKNRRPPAVLDPIEVAREGEHALRTRLAELSLDQLRDVVADYGMDPGKLVMKWKSPDRVIDRIVEIALPRAQKGDAFRGE
jgi:hypothetical protein